MCRHLKFAPANIQGAEVCLEGVPASPSETEGGDQDMVLRGYQGMTLEAAEYSRSNLTQETAPPQPEQGGSTGKSCPGLLPSPHRAAMTLLARSQFLIVLDVSQRNRLPLWGSVLFTVRQG